MNPPSIDIKDKLESSSVGVATYGTDLFCFYMPDSPHKCIALYDGPNWRQPQTSNSLWFPTVQAMIRGNRGGYTAAYTLAESVRDALHTETNETINSTTYVAVWCMSDIMFIGNDENDRPKLSINFAIIRRE